MMFSDVLDIHESYPSHADILGDGFLMHANPIYRQVKAFSEKIGCEYIEAYLEYLLLPFHELPKIVARKKIPYVPSARLMKDVEASHPGIFSTDDVPMAESYHMHEAAHVIADHFLKKITAKTPQEEILKAMLAESFANTVDALACASVTDDVHYFFLKQNCYMHPQKKVAQAMANVTGRAGFRFTFMLTYFTYLQANFLARPLTKKTVQDLWSTYATRTEPGAKVQKDILVIRAIGEKLDPRFRVTTTGNYLKQQGFEGDIHDLLDFAFMKAFAGNNEMAKAVESLCDLLDHTRDSIGRGAADANVDGRV